MIDIRKYNQKAWDKNVDDGSEYTLPVGPEVTQAARLGDWKIYLTPSRPVPRTWFPQSGRAGLENLDILCLASGGGQQGPVLAAAGGRVTVFDNSMKQLDRDRQVVLRDSLEIQLVEGDMRDLSVFKDQSFDLIVHPVSNLFIPKILPVWLEAARVLKPGGVLMAGFMNPVFYLFDREQMDANGVLQVKFPLPYSDLKSVSPEILQQTIDSGWPLEFGHSLEAQIGGQIDAGFMITGFFEDRDLGSPLDQYMPVYLATCATRVPSTRD